MDHLRRIGAMLKLMSSIEALEDNIEALIREIPAEMLERECKIGLSAWTI